MRIYVTLENQSVSLKSCTVRFLSVKRAQLIGERAIYKALDEYKHRKKITDEEYKLRVDFIKQHGTKEWEKVIQIKAEIEKLEKADKEFFDAELAKVKSSFFTRFYFRGHIGGASPVISNQNRCQVGYFFPFCYALSYRKAELFFYSL